MQRGGDTPNTIILLFLFGLLPFLISTLIVLPLLGAGPFGASLGAGLIPVAGEFLRNAFFGVGLGITHALIRRARAAKTPLLLD